MSATYEIIVHLTKPDLPVSQRREALKRFADENRWVPSDEIEDYPGTERFANGHLVVEHGLNNTAVISFLKSDHPYGILTEEEKLRLLGISYNNLVEWHLFPDPNGLTRVFNRVKSLQKGTEYISLSQNENVWRAEAFDKIIGRRPNPNIKALDDALMATISYWKRVLPGELRESLANENISALFNGLIFARALEDYNRRREPNSRRMLIEKWIAKEQQIETVSECIKMCITEFSQQEIPPNVLDEAKLRIFGNLDRETVLRIFVDFYDNRFAPYKYDFCLMSKQALSRIGEHYISLLYKEESPQLTFIEDLPKEIINRTFGGIFTPQYIARFFARYLKENLTPIVFRGLHTVDPACGSGIFLRTLLEMQCDPLQEIDMTQPTRDAFSNVMAVDKDENACQLTRLSLQLLHLVLTKRFASNLNIVDADALNYFLDRMNELRGSYDAVITNPPFIKWENMLPSQREILTKFLGNLTKGKPDLSLGFLKLGMDLLHERGFLMFVFPHSFLMAENAQKIRKEISRTHWVRYLVDLSEIDVFEGIGTYVILLIIQKQPAISESSPLAVIVRCKAFPGDALQAALEGKRVCTDIYDIYEVPQITFADEIWQILPPRQVALKTKLDSYPSLDNFLNIRVGFSTGASSIFIRDVSDIPKDEKEVYIPYLQDREMRRYSVPNQTEKMVFYPYVNNKKIQKEELKKKYNKTWSYLVENKKSLEERKAVKKGECEWWSPERARLPQNMLRPKIITPHLVLFSKFSLDYKGKYGISRSPLMYLKNPREKIELLYYYLAVMNSSVIYWQLATLSHRYSKGYIMLEPKTLKRLRIPDPNDISPNTMRELQDLVRQQITKTELTRDSKIDKIVAGLYRLSEKDCTEIGMNVNHGLGQD